ncbi:MAG: nucleotidyltransferase domain-containing protein [Candidatus Micrarchaeota archaeon]
MESIIKKYVDYAKDNLGSNLVAIIFTGSRVQGGALPHSDYDLKIIVKDINKRLEFDMEKNERYGIQAFSMSLDDFNHCLKSGYTPTCNSFNLLDFRKAEFLYGEKIKKKIPEINEILKRDLKSELIKIIEKDLKDVLVYKNSRAQIAVILTIPNLLLRAKGIFVTKERYVEELKNNYDLPQEAVEIIEKALIARKNPNETKDFEKEADTLMKITKECLQNN